MTHLQAQTFIPNCIAITVYVAYADVVLREAVRRLTATEAPGNPN